MLLSDTQLLVLNIVRSSVHSHFRFNMLRSLFFKRSYRFVYLGLDDILVENLVKSVLILVNFFDVPTLCLVAPTHMSRRESPDLL
jgi:hypothetical protein